MDIRFPAFQGAMGSRLPQTEPRKRGSEATTPQEAQTQTKGPQETNYYADPHSPLNYLIG